MMERLTGAGVGVVLLVAMAAGVGLLRSSGEPVALPAPPTAATTTAPTPSPTTAGTTSTTTAARVCRASDLQVTVEGSQGAGGTTYTPIAFRNLSPSPCGLGGHPRVSFLDPEGRVIAQALPVSLDTAAVTLSPGQLAGATIGVVSGCLGARLITPATVRVGLPGGGTASLAAGDLWICSGQDPSIRPFQKA